MHLPAHAEVRLCVPTALRQMQFLVQSTLVYSLTIEMVGSSTEKVVQGAVVGAVGVVALMLSVYAPFNVGSNVLRPALAASGACA